MKIFSRISESEMIEYTEENEGSYLQTKEMATLKASRGYEIFYVGVKDENKVLFASLLTKIKIRMGYIFEIDGIIVPKDKEIFDVFILGVQKFVKKNKGIYLTISPNDAYQIITDDGEITIENEQLLPLFEEKKFKHGGFGKGYSGNGNPNWVYTKDISQLTEKDFQESFNKEARYSIKKAKSFGITIRELSYGELPIFKKITQETSERRNFEDKSLTYYQAVFDAYGPKAKFLVAEINFKEYIFSLEKSKQELEKKIEELNERLEKNPKSRKGNNKKRELVDEKNTFEKRMQVAHEFLETEESGTVVLASSLFLISPSETVYLFSGTLEKYKKMYAPFLIQNEMIKYSVSQQIPLYNFYGIEGIFDGSDGVLKFKQAFNGFSVEKLGDFTYIAQPFKAKIYQLLKKLLNR